VGDAVSVPVEISQLFEDPQVTDVALNSFDRVSFKREGLWLMGSSPFGSDTEFSNWLVDLIEGADGRLDFAHPATSVSVDGFRVHALIGGQISANPSATIRRLRPSTNSVQFFDAASIRRMQVLRRAIAERQNVLIAGPAGAGKTSLLRELLSEVGADRVITIEEVPELALQSPNVVSLVARLANVEGAGEITLHDLLVETLRMSPDRIVVGEIRGVELLTILNALNTGHSGAGATIHANSLASVVSRLEAIASMAGFDLSALARMLIDSFDMIAFVDSRAGHKISGLAKFRLAAGQLSVEMFDV